MWLSCTYSAPVISSPIQNFGGIGVALISKLTLEAGSVNGIGTLAPVSSVLQETPHAKTDTAPRRIIIFFIL